MELPLIVAVLSCFACAAMFEAGMDTLADHFNGSIFDRDNPLFWDKSISWRNKYKDGDPAKGRKFFGSTTFLVFLTDGWHLLKFLRNRSLFLGITIMAVDWYRWPDWYVAVGTFVVLPVCVGVPFQYFYSRMR